MLAPGLTAQAIPRLRISYPDVRFCVLRCLPMHELCRRRRGAACGCARLWSTRSSPNCCASWLPGRTSPPRTTKVSLRRLSAALTAADEAPMRIPAAIQRAVLAVQSFESRYSTMAAFDPPRRAPTVLVPLPMLHRAPSADSVVVHSVESPAREATVRPVPVDADSTITGVTALSIPASTGCGNRLRPLR